MIADRLENADSSMPFPALAEAIRFLRGLDPETPNGEYEIQDRRIFARVMRYKSIPRARGKLESHRRYADIQALLSGRECIEWVPLTGDESVEYDQEKDVSFHPAPSRSYGDLCLRPGLFALFMPGDAHMPMLMADGEPEEVTKVVIKVDVGLLKEGILD